MGSIQGHELSLGCRPTTYRSPSVSEFLGQVSMIGNVSERLRKFDEYIIRLEDEMGKIDAFKRELPLCMILLNDAIVAVKEEAMQCRNLNVKPVLEEFIPLKKSCDEDDDKKIEVKKDSKDSNEKMDWLSSVQLWNGDNHYPNLDFTNNKQTPKPEIRKRAEEVTHTVSNDPSKSCVSQSVGTAFVPFNGYNRFPRTKVRNEEKEELPVVTGLSLQTPGIKNQRDDIGSFGLISKTGGATGSSSACNGEPSARSGLQTQQQETTRKQRRCWSPELHRRFVDALQQLGGSQVATPKQIRELMQVDGLTNDEVKSHLQKYRLHTRRASSTSAPTPNQSAVLLEGLWPPQDQFGESSKQNNSQSGSPQGPLHFGGSSRATSVTGANSLEDEDDEKSESHSWKSHVHSSNKNNV